jgi:hypothetical protein
MAPSDISLRPIPHNPHTPVRTVAPAPSQATSGASAAATAAPSFPSLLASFSSVGVAASALSSPAAAAAPTLPAAATDGPAGPLFGANPWLADPTGSGPGPVTNYNPIYFATPQTAQTVAQMVGGTVVSTDVFTPGGGPFQQNEPNLMVQLPNGGLINPGLVADIYTHGWNQAFVNQQVANEVAGAVPASTNT